MAVHPPNMAELARLAGCSVMTVSYALRNSQKISPTTREKIQRLAREHGYVKHPQVAALMASRRSGQRPGTETIALLTKFDVPIGQWLAPQPFYSDLHEGMLRQARTLGFQLEEFPTFGPDAPSGARLSQILRARGIRGIIFMPGGGLERPFPELQLNDFVAVAAAFHAREMPIHRTASDHSGGMAIALEKSLARGYQRIGLTMNQRLDPEVRFAFSGRFLAWQQTRPTRSRIPLIPGTGHPVPLGEFKKWLMRYQPECLLITGPDILETFQQFALSKNVKPGVILLPTRGQRDVAGVDGLPAEVGRCTINCLARELFLNHFGAPEHPEVVLVKGRWQDGPTLPNRSSQARKSPTGG